MDNKNKKFEPEKLKIVSSLQYIGVIIGFTFTIGTTYGTFGEVKKQVEMLQEKVENLNEKLLDKIDSQNREINQHLTELNKTTANIQGKLEVIDEYKREK